MMYHRAGNELFSKMQEIAGIVCDVTRFVLAARVASPHSV
jgi:hypothetical protein